MIGNVPFADVKLDYRGQKLSLHDFFFAKSVDALKPGGVLALVTVHFTLDKQNAAIREYLAEQADFLGAIRLPSDAFKREGTAVVTDIVFLRKRAPGEPAQPRRPGMAATPRRWPSTAPTIPINRYFLNHPEMVLGTWSRKDTLYGATATASSATAIWPSSSASAIGRLPEVAPLASRQPQRRAPRPPSRPRRRSATSPKAASSSATTASSARSMDGQAVPVIYGGTLLKADGTMTGKRLAALIGLRDHARRVLQSQNEGWPEAAPRRGPPRTEPRLRPLRRRLRPDQQDHLQRNRRRQRHPPHAQPGEIPRGPGRHAGHVAGGLRRGHRQGRPKPPSCRRTWWARPRPSPASPAPRKGCWCRSNQRGAVDLPFIAALYGKPEAAIIAELGDLIFHDPESKTWQTADAYLSGNVRAKLAAAEQAGPAYARNAEALRAVQPEDVLPGDIDANLGRRGFRKPTSRHSPPSCSASRPRPSRSAT